MACHEVHIMLGPRDRRLIPEHYECECWGLAFFLFVVEHGAVLLGGEAVILVMLYVNMAAGTEIV